jgi:23S rRNA pseudouridine2605 synthase
LSSNPVLPSADQLLAARTALWHQDAQPLLTLEAVRTWLNTAGLVLYTPRPQQIPSPAPSFVEAVLGSVQPAPSIAEIGQARPLLARLIADGAAVPLNLLGVTGGTGTDVPDFVVSAAVFSYIFTLRGNKAWKLPPVTAGPVKVSPLALAAYEALDTETGLSAYDLATHLGKEVTEAAVLRALTELWTQLRVIPVPQVDGSATLWELTSARFTKQIKAGSNAGQPSALSALISLYLGQSLMASEDEIETFLSPLASRSRLRDVIHALLSARQLDTLVIEGKTLLHIAGDLPAFAAEAKPEVAIAAESEVEAAEEEDAPRIAKFTPRPGSKLGTGLRSRPAAPARPMYGARPGAKPSFGNKPSIGGDRERRPFKRDDAPARPERPARPAFDKPWKEDRAARPARPAASASERGSQRPTSRVRPSFGDKPAFGGGEGQPPRREFKPRAFEPRTEGGEFKPRTFKPRPESEGSAPRKTFSKPGTFGRKREGFPAKPSFGGGEGRPPRRDFAASAESSERPARRPGSFTPRPSSGFKPRTEEGGRPAFGRKPFTPRSGGDRPTFGAKPAFGSKPPYKRDRPEQASGGEGAPPRKTFRKFDAPRTPRPFDPDKPRTGFGAKPGGKKPFVKSGGGFAKAGGPFAKFADGAKPFRKPGPGKSSAGGSKPASRDRKPGFKKPGRGA